MSSRIPPPPGCFHLIQHHLVFAIVDILSVPRFLILAIGVFKTPNNPAFIALLKQQSHLIIVCRLKSLMTKSKDSKGLAALLVMLSLRPPRHQTGEITIGNFNKLPK